MFKLPWKSMDVCPLHDRALFGSTNQPHVIGWDGERVGEARNYDGQWYWMSGDPAALLAWQEMPPPPDWP